MRLAPHPSWKGRVINALGVPIDAAGPLQQGEATRRDQRRAAARHAPRADRATFAHRHPRHRSLHADLRRAAHRHLRRLRGRQIDPSRHARRRARLRRRRHRSRRRARPRGARISRRCARRPIARFAVAVVATGDESPIMRRLAPRTAMAVAEFFRDRGDAVLLIVDSMTRFAHAARDVALAAGEPAVARGYAPSVFSDLPRLLERAGPGEEGKGSITGIFSVLVDGDDHNDPVADADARHARRPYRSRSRHRRQGALSRRRCSRLDLAPRADRLDQ